MGFFRKIGEFLGIVKRELPKPKPKRKANAAPRTLPKSAPTHVSRETPKEYIVKLTELVDKQTSIRRVEAVMFDEDENIDVRKAALDEYTTLTGWYRPENNDTWSSEEWRRWEQIYESEPEVF